METTEQKNEVIALWDGWVIDNSFPDKGRVYRKGAKLEMDTTLKYHSSWDWIKPVIDKIAEYRLAYPEQTALVCDCKVVVEIQYLHENVFQFCQWHNSLI